MVGIGETGTDLFRCIDAFWKSRDCRRAIASFHVKSCKEWGSDTFFLQFQCVVYRKLALSHSMTELFFFLHMTRSFIHSFIHSFVRLFVCLFICEKIFI